MSSTFLSANDLNRLDRERMLTIQAPRVPLEQERTPPEYEPEDPSELLRKVLLMAIERELQ